MSSKNNLFSFSLLLINYSLARAITIIHLLEALDANCINNRLKNCYLHQNPLNENKTKKNSTIVTTFQACLLNSISKFMLFTLAASFNAPSAQKMRVQGSHSCRLKIMKLYW